LSIETRTGTRCCCCMAAGSRPSGDAPRCCGGSRRPALIASGGETICAVLDLCPAAEDAVGDQAQDHGRVASRVGRLEAPWLVEMPSFPGRRSDRTARSAVSAGSVGAVHRPVVAVDELACVGAPRALLPPSADRSGAGMVAHLGPGRRRARWPRSVHPAGGESGGRSGGSPPVVRLGQRRGRGPGGRCG
jgi:hypothetical protein